MANYTVGNSSYDIPDDVQGEELQNILTQLASQEQPQSQPQSQQAFQQQQPVQQDASFSDLIGRGVDDLQATGGGILEAGGELFGIDSLDDFGQEIRERNQAEAEQYPEADNLLDMVAQSIPSLGVIGTGAGGGAAIGTMIAPGIGTGLGAFAGGLLASFGLNVGDTKVIQDMIGDEESQYGLTQLAISTAATVPDLLFGGLVTAPAKKLAKEEAKSMLKSEIAKTVAKNVGTKVAVETGKGAAGASLSAAALLGGSFAAEGGTDMLSAQADAISESVGDAFLLGGLFSSSVATATSAGQIAQTPSLRDLATDADTGGIKQDADGNVQITEPNNLVVENAKYLTKRAGDWVVAAAGKSTDSLTRKYPENEMITRFADSVVQRPEGRSRSAKFKAERDKDYGGKDEFGDKYDGSTISNDATRTQATFKKMADTRSLAEMSAKDLKKVKDDVSSGSTANPAANKVRAAFEYMYSEAGKAGKSVGNMGANYFPFFMDRSKFTVKGSLGGKLDVNKQSEFVKGAIDDLVTSGKLDPNDKAAMDKQRIRLNRYVENAISDGNVRVGENYKTNKKLEDTVEAAYLGDKKAIDELSRPIFNELDVNILESNLDVHRELSDLSQTFLNKWANEESIIATLENYSDLASTSIAATKKFGANGEKLSRTIRMAVADGIQSGNRIDPRDIKMMLDIANAAQKLPTGDVSPTTKAFYRNIRGLSNALNLQGALASSIMEPYFLLREVGGKAFASGLAKTTLANVEAAARTYSKAAQALPKSERLQLIDELGISMTESLSSAAAKIGEDAIGITSIEQAVFKYSGLAPWTQFTKQWAAFAAEDAIKSVATKLDKETKPKKIKKLEDQLWELGLDPDQVRIWNTESKASREDPYFQDSIRDGIRTLTRDALVLPEHVDLPLWASNPHMILFANLKSFALAFNNTILLKWIKALSNAGQDPAKAAATVATIGIAIPAFILVDALKAATNGKLDDWQDKEPEEILVRAAGRLGGLSLAMEPFTGAQFGKNPVEAMMSPVADVLSLPIDATTQTYGLLTGEIDVEEYMQSFLEKITKTTPIIGGMVQGEFD
ncbi:hypothetical protein N8314_00745 [Akkermansiaceae bacterium]|nr:hypothetical protein [Akkermansiaceae bacterium]